MRNSAKIGVIIAVVILGMTRSSGYLQGAIALTGDPNPRGGTFQSFYFPLINSLGQAAFVADEPGGFFPTLYRYDYGTGSLATVIEFGSPFLTSSIAINDRGDIAFGQSTGLVTFASLVRWTTGVTTAIASAGDPTPLGGTFTHFSGPALTQGAFNNQGALVFIANYLTAEGTTSNGIFVGDGVTTRPVAVLGDPTPVGGVFSNVFGYQYPVMNDNGDVLFWADVSGGSALHGLFLSRGGSFHTVMTPGQPTPIGSVYAANPGGNLHSINNAREIAFDSPLEDGRHALLRWNNGVTTKAVSSDDIAPSGIAFLGLQRPVLNESGALAFAAAGSPGEGLYMEYRGVIRTILSGSDPPGIYQGRFDFNDRGDFVVSNGGGLFFLRAQADLAVTKTDDPDPVTVGNFLTYTAAVANNGPDFAFGVTFTDTLPASLTYLSSSTTNGSCTGTSSVTCSIGTLAPGEVATVTIVGTPTAEGGLLNTATITSFALDEVPANNTDSEATAVLALPPPPPPPAETVGGSVTGLGSIHVECRNLSRRRRQPGSFVAFELPPGVISWDCELRGLIVTSGDQIEIRVTGVAN